MDSLNVELVDSDGDDQGTVTVFGVDDDGDIQVDFGGVHLNASPASIRRLAIAMLNAATEDE